MVVVGVVMIPIFNGIANDNGGDDGGGTGEVLENPVNPNVPFSLEYAEKGNVPDFSFELNAYSGDCTLNGESLTIQNPYVNLMNTSIFYSESVAVLLSEGMVFVNFSTLEVGVASSISITSVNENLTVTTTLNQTSNQYEISDFGEWCYYPSINGHFSTAMDSSDLPTEDEDIPEGVVLLRNGIYYDRNYPTCPALTGYLNSEGSENPLGICYFDKKYILSTNTNQIEQGIDYTYTLNDDGAITGVEWEGVQAEHWVVSIVYPHIVEISSGGSSDSGSDLGTVGTIMAVIPIFVILGILMYAVQYFRGNKI